MNVVFLSAGAAAASPYMTSPYQYATLQQAGTGGYPGLSAYQGAVSASLQEARLQ